MKTAFMASGGISILAILLMLAVPGDRPAGLAPKKLKLSMHQLVSVEILNYALVSGLFSAVNGIIASYLLLFSESRGIGSISIYFTIYAVCMFNIRPSSGKLMDRCSELLARAPGSRRSRRQVLKRSAETASVRPTVPTILAEISVRALDRSLGARSSLPLDIHSCLCSVRCF